jgi:hypothetical protein
MDSGRRNMDRLRRLIAGAVERVLGRQSVAVTFGTWPRRPGTRSRHEQARQAQLMNALAMVERVEQSPVIRSSESRGQEKGPHISELRIHGAGVTGVIDLPKGQGGKLRGDIDGMPIEVIGSDGTMFAAVCSGTSATENGPRVRFVFEPAPADSTIRISISVSPFGPIGARSEPLVLWASLPKPGPMSS